MQTSETHLPAPRRSRLVAAATAFAVFVPVALAIWWTAYRTADEGAVPAVGDVVGTLTLESHRIDPEATLEISGVTQVGLLADGCWDQGPEPGDGLTACTADRLWGAEVPAGYLKASSGGTIDISGDAPSVAVAISNGSYPFRSARALNVGPDGAILPDEPGRYALIVTATFPRGEARFYFGVEVVDEPAPNVFFPTWDMNARPDALVGGTLIERDGCLFSSVQLDDSLVLWERGLDYRNGSVLDGDRVVARLGEPFSGGGGYYSSAERAFVEDLIGEPIPERCMPTAAGGFVLAYDVSLGDATSEPSPDTGPAITVVAPEPGAVVSTPVTIEGTANVFEGTVRIRIVDAINNQIADTYTTATCGSGCEGTFSTQVDFSVAEAQQGEIVVFEESAETGKPINQVRIPVTLLPGPTVAEASGFVGRWTDAGGGAVIEDVVSSMLGPEHCSWGDIVFLRYQFGATDEMPGPIDVANTTFVRDTTGELGAFTRGRWEEVGEPDAGLVDTGYRVNGRELWIDPDDPDAVILWDPASGVTERWPVLQEEIGCA